MKTLKKSKSSKKAQAETIGLVVIVIILILAVLMYLRFTIQKPQSTLPGIRTNLIGSNTLTAAMSTTLCNKQLSDILIYCYTSNNAPLCDKPSCDYFDEEMQKILKLALPQKNYELTITINSQPYRKFGNCQTGIVAATYPIHSQKTFFDTKLKLC